MASDSRPTEKSVIERLQETPYRFEFYQAVRLFECRHPDLPRIGQSQKPGQDPIRFGQEPSLAFAPASLSALEYRAESKIPKLLVQFMGLLGPNGPLPNHITQYVKDRLHNDRDRTLACFLDIFHHRAISLFYRAWASNQPTISRDRPGEDRFARYIDSLIGIGFDSQQNRDSIQDDAKRYFAGRLALQNRNAEGLESIVGDYFGVETRIQQFIGQWVDLPPEYHCRLGESPCSGCVGQTAIMGTRFWDCQQKFRLIMGPLSLEQYQRMLPGDRSYLRLRDWIRNYVGFHLSWDLQLILKIGEAPRIQLGSQGKLGWTTWMVTEKLDRLGDDLILQPPAA